MAKFLPAGSSLIFQMHYTPVGSVQQDISRIGFLFADPQQVDHEVKTLSAFQPHLRIPPESDNHVEMTRTRLNEPVKVLAFMPHLHLRGKSFAYLSRPPGQTEWTTLLDVPQYDFNWQTAYRLAEPLSLPRGSEIKCIAHYDNSEDNPNNPDPQETVRWGEQTWDEMLIGYFDVAVAVDPSQREIVSDRKTADARRVEEFILQLDRNEDDQLQLNELPARMQRPFSAADHDQDGLLSPTEIQQAMRRPGR